MYMYMMEPIHKIPLKLSEIPATTNYQEYRKVNGINTNGSCSIAQFTSSYIPPYVSVTVTMA